MCVKAHTHTPLHTGILPPGAISCLPPLQHESHTDVTSPTSCVSCCIQSKNLFFFITIRLIPNITCVLPPLPLPSRFSSKHNQPHSASTMRHYASLVATLFSKSFVRPRCFLHISHPTTSALCLFPDCPGSKCHKVNSIKSPGKSATWWVLRWSVWQQSTEGSHGGSEDAENWFKVWHKASHEG